MEISEDLRLTIEINALCARVTAIVDERDTFVDELDILGERREFELRAQEKGIFIEKLKGNLDLSVVVFCVIVLYELVCYVSVSVLCMIFDVINVDALLLE
ncbi:hypothetical protein Tco_0247315 [Tanacetum coccineum]